MKIQSQVVPISTTSEALSQAVDRILRRFPDNARPSKNALLNDLAAEIRPGKNWGGLRAEIAQGLVGKAAKDPNPVVSLAEPHPQPTTPGERVITAVLRRYRDDSGIFKHPLLYNDISISAFSAGWSGYDILGICLRVLGDGYFAQLDTWPYIILQRNGTVFLEMLSVDDMDGELAVAIYFILQEADRMSWKEILEPEGFSSAYVLIGASHAVTIFDRETLEAASKRKFVDEHSQAAIRLFVSDEMPEERAKIEANRAILLAEVTLPALTKAVLNKDAKAMVRFKDSIVLDTEFTEFLTHHISVPYLDASSDFMFTKSDGNWADDNENRLPTEDALRQHDANLFAHVLGEALSFVLDYHRLSRTMELFLIARCSPAANRDDPRIVEQNWQLIAWQNGKVGAWGLANEEDDLRFRQRAEAWLKQERLMLVPSLSSSPETMTIVVRPNSRRNTTHWERAVKLFNNIP